MFKKVKRWFWGRDNARNKRVGEHVAQAYLSGEIMKTLDLAMKLDLKVIIEIKVGGRHHAMGMPGKDNPAIQAIHDMAKAYYLDEHRKADLELRIRDLSEARDSGRRVDSGV